MTLGVDDSGHILSFASTGAGKNLTSVIPNLLTYGPKASVFVIDVKGENHHWTAKARGRMGQSVHALDPFGETGAEKPACYNPLDFIDPGDAGITQADGLADSIIMREGNGENRHFSDESQALLKAAILHVCSWPAFEGRRNLGTINKIACAPTALIGDKETKGQMMENPAYDGLIQRLALRMRGKGDREGPAVWSTLQANLAWLDDPRIARSLASTSPGLDFADLRKGKMSVYAVLPVRYLHTFSRWLRLLVGDALGRMLGAMNGTNAPALPALFVLDEAAHLGYLESIKTAFGLARGASVKMWGILQTLSQLDDVYGQAGRETMIGNCGGIEVFNISDNTGCEYFSKKMGTRDVETRSLTVADSIQHQSADGTRPEQETTSRTETVSYSVAERPWMRPHEIATMDPQKKIVFRRGCCGPEGQPFSIVNKVWVTEHPCLRKLAGLR